MARLSYSCNGNQHWISKLQCNHTDNAMLSFHTEHANCILCSFQYNFAKFKCTCHFESSIGKMCFIKKEIRKCHDRYIHHVSLEQAPSSPVSQNKCYTGLSDCSLSTSFSLFVAISYPFIMMWIMELTDTCTFFSCLFYFIQHVLKIIES